MRNITVCFFLLGLFYACDSEPAGQEQAPGPYSPLEVKLSCESIATDPDADPRHAVYISVGEYKTKIAEIAGCNPIDSTAYADYQIPAEAIDAIGGWWAGAGSYFFVLQENGEVVIYEGGVDEMQVSSSYGYIPIGSFEDGRFLPIPPKPRVTGLYVWEGQDTSWIVLVDRIDGKTSAQYVVQEGMLPPDGDLLQEIGNMAFQPFTAFALDTDDLTFTSDWGTGKFAIEDEQMELIFLEKPSQLEAQLVLKKMSN